MKKGILIASMGLLVVGSSIQAQNNAAIKTEITLGNYVKAKDDIDKGMKKDKFANTAESHLQKSLVYIVRSYDSLINATTPDVAKEMATEAVAAFDKYLSLEANGKLLSDNVYSDLPFYLHDYKFNNTLSNYFQKEQYAEAAKGFQNVLDYNDKLIKLNVALPALDTMVLLLAAYSYEQIEEKATALKYYKLLADAKVGGEGKDAIYQFLTRYSFEQNKLDDFDKYQAIGKELYPENSYFTLTKTDFALGLESSDEGKLKSLQNVLKEDPYNYVSNLGLIEILFTRVHGDGEKPTSLDAEKAMLIESFARLQEKYPDSLVVPLYQGNHFFNEAVTLVNARATEMDEKKKLDYDKQIVVYYDKAIPFYIKAEELYTKKPSKNNNEKQEHKSIASYLIDIYSFKAKVASDAKQNAEVAKLDKEIDKWEARYDELSGLK